MPREGESLARGGQVRTALRFCFVGLVVRGNYVWCLVIFVIFMGIGGAEVGDALKSSFGVAMQATRVGRQFQWRRRGGAPTIINAAVLKLCYWVL